MRVSRQYGSGWHVHLLLINVQALAPLSCLYMLCVISILINATVEFTKIGKAVHLYLAHGLHLAVAITQFLEEGHPSSANRIADNFDCKCSEIASCDFKRFSFVCNDASAPLRWLMTFRFTTKLSR